MSKDVIKAGVERLGTALDTRPRRRKLVRSYEACQGISERVEAALAELRRAAVGGDAGLRSRAERDGRQAVREFRETSRAFETAMRAVGGPREDESVGGRGAGSEEEGSGGAGLGEGVQMTELRSVANGKVRVAYELALEQRDEMREIAREIGDVEELSKDLGDSVAVHSEGVAVVVENVTTALAAVKAGNDSIRKAAEAQRAARRKMCCIALVVLVVLACILGPTLTALLGGFSSSSS